MPFIGERLGLTSAVSASGTTALLNVDFVKGAFKVYESKTLVGISPNLFADNQIIFVEDSGSLYKADVVLVAFGIIILSFYFFIMYFANKNNFLCG